ncbi:MAG TPA: cupin domain-containing protein [Chloroflexota bacterium]|jgi:mannose-6-phosphate isomerase-like protein (cupin superfamily)|nr:cupin domain-containing protein [Chloroflexota bacterium]
MAVEERKTLVPVQVKDEDKVNYGRVVDRREQRGPFQFFRVAPELPEGRNRAVERLAGSDIESAIVHIIRQGGENDLHAHRAQDAVWLVLEGQITFYDQDHQAVAVLNPREGLFVPRGTPYYFSSTGDQTAILLRVSAKATDVPNERWDYARPFDSSRD